MIIITVQARHIWRTTSLMSMQQKLSSQGLHASRLFTSSSSSSSSATARMLPQSTFNVTLYSRILDFWFDGMTPGSIPSRAVQARWFGLGDQASRDAFDEECKTIAGEALDLLGPAKWPLPAFESVSADMSSAPDFTRPFEQALGETSSAGSESLSRSEVALAMVVLLDQFPRNIFRSLKDEKKVFNHYDRLAVAISRSVASSEIAESSTFSGLDQDQSMRSDVGRRNWFYLPLMHSEDLSDHRLLASKYQEMKQIATEEGNEDAIKYIDKQTSFEERHLKLIEQFGRYPHRNECLGRQETLEEKTYLENGGERFGR